MDLFKLMAALLDYPSEETIADVRALIGGRDIRKYLAELDRESQFTRGERGAIAAFVERLLSIEPAQQQEEYVKTFDLTPEHSLHLTHHIFGEEKTRGPALIDLSEYYKSYGVEHGAHELPDYLPLMLEFVSLLQPDEGRVFLADVAKVLKALANNLEEAKSPYAPLLRVVENYGRLTKLAPEKRPEASSVGASQ
jgi:nitrate reductase molybdenum cofactor assembly chaperone NarJ/NarW